jgi:hypothetical protein
MSAPTRRLFALAACGALLTAALPASAWNWNWGKGERVRGNGEVVTEARSLGDFDAIALHGDLNAPIPVPGRGRQGGSEQRAACGEGEQATGGCGHGGSPRGMGSGDVCTVRKRPAGCQACATNC